MELTGYAGNAVRLANTDRPERGEDDLRTLEDAARLFAEADRDITRLTETDVVRLRSVRARLRMVFTHASRGEEADAAAVLNGLLAEYPVHPRITGHDGRPWHLHLADDTVGAADGYAAVAAMGLATQLTAHGMDRLGVCRAGPCRNVFLDTSVNRSRRYCSDRCATRSNVAAHRARRRQGLVQR